MSLLPTAAALTAAVLTAAGGGTYDVTVIEHTPTPVIAATDECLAFNPAFIPASPTFNQSGVLVRQCCGKTCTGHGRRADARVEGNRRGFEQEEGPAPTRAEAASRVAERGGRSSAGPTQIGTHQQ